MSADVKIWADSQVTVLFADVTLLVGVTNDNVYVPSDRSVSGLPVCYDITIGSSRALVMAS